jgi:hypothetical protein
MLGCHGGKQFLLTSTVGAATTTCSLLLSQFINNNRQTWCSSVSDELYNQYSQPRLTIPRLDIDFIDIAKQQLQQMKRSEVKKRYIRETCLGLLAFMAIEKGAFRTAFPSSVLALGVFANHGNKRMRSIFTDSPVATKAQRLTIQKLGKAHGCHHCGNRQWFKVKPFIADHMPPTKFANEGNLKWYRSILNMKMEQRLWPQCQKCWLLQGSAVRQNLHIPIYHMKPRLFHLAPAIAFFLCTNKDVEDVFDEFVVEPTMHFVDFVKDHI